MYIQSTGLYLVVALFVTLLGCAAPTTLDVGYHGSDEGYAAALEAAAAWNETCRADLIQVHRGDGDVQLYETWGTVGGQALGETHLERPFLTFLGPKEPTEIRFMRGWEALPVLAHEFGHAMGLQHGDGGIMTPGNELPSMREQLDPATQYETLLPGLITPELCAAIKTR